MLPCVLQQFIQNFRRFCSEEGGYCSGITRSQESWVRRNRTIKGGLEKTRDGNKVGEEEFNDGTLRSTRQEMKTQVRRGWGIGPQEKRRSGMELQERAG